MNAQEIYGGLTSHKWPEGDNRHSDMMPHRPRSGLEVNGVAIDEPKTWPKDE